MDKKFDYQYSLCNDDDIFYRNGGIARSTIIKTIDEVNETRDQAFRNSKSFIYISGSDTLVTKLPCVQLHSNGKQRIRRMVKYRGSLALSHISISTLRFFHEIRFKHDGWFHVTIEQRDERTTYPRCFVLFLSFRYFRLIIFRATVSYTRIRDEFHRTIIRTKPRSELSLAKAFSYLRERENHSLDIIRETLETFILQFVRKLLKAFRPITRIR